MFSMKVSFNELYWQHQEMQKQTSWTRNTQNILLLLVLYFSSGHLIKCYYIFIGENEIPLMALYYIV